MGLLFWWDLVSSESSCRVYDSNIGSALFGYFADHYKSRRLPFVLGLLALVISTCMFAAAISPAVLVTARALQGLSAAAVWVVGLALIVDNVHESRIGQAMGSITLAMTMGGILGPMLGGLMYVSLMPLSPIDILTILTGMIGWAIMELLFCPPC